MGVQKRADVGRPLFHTATPCHLARLKALSKKKSRPWNARQGQIAPGEMEDRVLLAQAGYRGIGAQRDEVIVQGVTDAFRTITRPYKSRTVYERDAHFEAMSESGRGREHNAQERRGPKN